MLLFIPGHDSTTDQQNVALRAAAPVISHPILREMGFSRDVLSGWPRKYLEHPLAATKCFSPRRPWSSRWPQPKIWTKEVRPPTSCKTRVSFLEMRKPHVAKGLPEMRRSPDPGTGAPQSIQTGDWLPQESDQLWTAIPNRFKLFEHSMRAAASRTF
jgi:hypothetical protein